MNKWISFSDLCKRWGMNKHELAELVIDGKRNAVDSDDLSLIFVTTDGEVSMQRNASRKILSAQQMHSA
jgi:hypothetical protein